MAGLHKLTRVGLLAASIFALGGCVAAQAQIYPPRTSGPVKPMQVKTTQSLDQILQAFPPAREGMQRLVISVPPQANETAYRVGFTAGRMQMTDGVNTVRLAGQFRKGDIKGWGYSFYELEGADRPAISTMMGARPGREPVEKYVSVAETLVRYNSRMPLVVYVPQGYDVRYRIYSAGDSFTATENGSLPQAPQPVVTAHDNGSVYLASPQVVNLPAGSVATIRLYDHMLMDTNSTYATSQIVIDKIPATLALPYGTGNRRIAGPAVSVSIRDPQGQLLYHNDTVTPLDDKGTTYLDMKAVHR